MNFLKKRLVVNGSEEAKGFDALLNNDDIRLLALKDRTWTGYNILYLLSFCCCYRSVSSVAPS